MADGCYSQARCNSPVLHAQRHTLDHQQVPQVERVIRRRHPARERSDIGTERLFVAEGNSSHKGTLGQQDIGGINLPVDVDISGHRCAGCIKRIGSRRYLVTIRDAITIRVRHKWIEVTALGIGIRRVVVEIDLETIRQPVVVRVAVQRIGSQVLLDCVSQSVLVVILVNVIRQAIQVGIGNSECTAHIQSTVDTPGKKILAQRPPDVRAVLEMTTHHAVACNAALADT